MPFYSIRISKDEWDRSMKLLFDLGLKAAAVTAPLKNLVNQFVQPQSSDQSALNSLARTSDGWKAINTDREGFQDSVADLQLLSPIQQGFCVWGGGGTLESIRAILPRAIYFSGRAGLPRENSSSVGKDYAPRVLVWAAGSSDDIKFPPEHWRPQCVLDLSYRDCSMGLEYAQKVGCLYVSGEKMFVQQAIHQQNFWREFLSSEINEDSV
jgi:shikimate 5-dehydrogenase